MKSLPRGFISMQHPHSDNSLDRVIALYSHMVSIYFVDGQFHSTSLCIHELL